MRVAVIDCGTNTIRLLIADGDGDGLTDVARELRFARLGQDIDATGRFHPDALRRAFAVLDDYAAAIRAADVDVVRMVATSAVRDVSNRDEFIDGVRARLGLDPEVIAGAEEAELSFLGALSGGPLPGAGSPDPRVLVMDIGGGSTELIRGRTTGAIEAAVSLDMGAVRIRERFLQHDPPHPDEVAAARVFVAGLLDGSGVLDTPVDVHVGVAGTPTSLSAMNQGLTTYDPRLVHDSVIDAATVAALTGHLLGLRVADIIRAYPSLQPQRASVITAGSVIADEVVARVGLPIVVRETDILDGAALKLMHPRAARDS